MPLAVASDASMHRFCADAYNLIVDTILFQGFADLFEGNMRVAVGTSTTIYH